MKNLLILLVSLIFINFVHIENSNILNTEIQYITILHNKNDIMKPIELDLIGNHSNIYKYNMLENLNKLISFENILLRIKTNDIVLNFVVKIHDFYNNTQGFT